MKSFQVGNIVNQNDSMSAWIRIKSTFVVSVGNGSEPLLSGGIPDLKFDIFRVGVDSFEPEIDADGGHVVFVELVVGEP